MKVLTTYKVENITLSGVKQVFAEIAQYPEEILDPEAHLEKDLGINSVKLDEIYAVLKKQYQLPELHIPPEQLTSIQGVYETLISHASDFKIPKETHSSTVTAEPSISKAEFRAQSEVKSPELKKYNSLIESVGTYLPSEIHSSSDIVNGCDNKVRIPLEFITGIKNRRRAGKTEFSKDLAANAVMDCLNKSKYSPEAIDLIICCNISRRDRPNHKFSIEPSTAMELKRMFSLTNALAFNINNACAGMFTGIFLANSMIKSNRIQRALIVSGEYITHLTDTAQREIESVSDLRLACLTLGDSGAAVLLDRSEDLSVGFHDVDLVTISRYSDLCTAGPTNRINGGGIMNTHSKELALNGIYHTIRHTREYMKNNEWSAGQVDHLITHQIAKKMTDLFREEFNKLPETEEFAKKKLIHNVKEIGNTSTTTHTLAMNKNIMDGNIKNGHSTVFAITASGLTIGTGLYKFDDLPERLRAIENGGSRPEKVTVDALPPVTEIEKPVASLESLAILPENKSLDSFQMAALAGKNCLEKSRYQANDINVLISSGVHKSDCLDEPSNAALIASELKLNDDFQSEDYSKKSFAFDLYNGSIGWLNATYLAQEQIRSGIGERIMLVASEAEINKNRPSEQNFNLAELGTAAILHASRYGEGFSNFFFETHDQYIREYISYFDISTNQTKAHFERSDNYETLLMGCLHRTLSTYIKSLDMKLADMDYIIGPQISPDFDAALEDLLNSMEVATRAGKRIVSYESHGKDLYTSSLACGLSGLLEGEGRGAAVGQKALLLAVGSGIQTGCALYHF